MKFPSLAAIIAVSLFSAAAQAEPAKSAPEARYLAARDAAIAKIAGLYDAKKSDDAAKTEETARGELRKQLETILGDIRRPGFGPAELNLEALSKGDEGFGMLDGLRYQAELGLSGQKAGQKTAAGDYVQPRATIIVTTPTLFAHWLREHKNWWNKGMKNVPQQIGAALRDESFFTQAVTSDSAVIAFNPLPVAKPAAAASVTAMLAGQTQDTIPDAADEVFVSALAGDKVFIAYGSIKPKVRVPACTAIRAGYNKRAEQDGRDQSDALRQQGEEAFQRCFVKAAPAQPAFADATKQAQALLAEALGK